MIDRVEHAPAGATEARKADSSEVRNFRLQQCPSRTVCRTVEFRVPEHSVRYALPGLITVHVSVSFRKRIALLHEVFPTEHRSSCDMTDLGVCCLNAKQGALDIFIYNSSNNRATPSRRCDKNGTLTMCHADIVCRQV